MYIIIFLFFSLPNTKANEYIDLPKDLEKLWIHSQAFIFYNPNKSKHLGSQKPDCFGNILTPQFIITAASCFMNINKILKFSETHSRKPSEIQEKKIISESLKKGLTIEKIRIVVNVSIIEQFCDSYENSV